MFTRNLVTLLMVVVVTAIACPAMAEFVAHMPAGLHRGSDNPTTEGWTAEGGGVGQTSGAGAETIGTLKFDYWHVTDGGSGYSNYHSAVQTGLTGVWTATAVLRANDTLGNGNLAWSCFAGYDDGSTMWGPAYYRDSTPVEGLYTNLPYGSSQVTPMDIHSNYNIYQLVYDPAVSTTSANAYINGILLGALARSDNGAAQGTTGKMTIGSWASDATMGANYAYVNVEAGTHIYSDLSLFATTVPEPSAIVLCVTGLIGLLAYAWRKRK